MAGESEDKNQEEEEEFVAVEEDPNEQGADDEQEQEEEGEEQEATDDEGQEEARLGGGREDDDDEERTRRREAQKTRRQRQKEAKDRTNRELNFLRKRNEELEQRFSRFEQETDARVTGSEIANIDTAINKMKSDLQLANQVISQAVESQSGKDLAEAMDHRDTIRDNLRDLEQAKEYLADRKDRETEQPQLDPRHVAYANQFMVDHEWWDPNGRDRESRQVLEIDRALAADGFDPRTKEYWDELRERVQEALPDRFESQDDQSETEDKGGSGNGKDQKRQSRGPQFRTGGRERPLKKNEVYISPERRQAMEEAGVWEDPVLRQRYLKSYAEYDRAAQEEGA